MEYKFGELSNARIRNLINMLYPDYGPGTRMIMCDLCGLHEKYFNEYILLKMCKPKVSFCTIEEDDGK